MRTLARTSRLVRGARLYHGQNRTPAAVTQSQFIMHSDQPESACCVLAFTPVGLLQWPAVLNAGLEDVDPVMFDIIEKEKNRLFRGLELIPSEVRSNYVIFRPNPS